MRAGVFRGVRQVPIEDLPDPDPGPRDIVLDVKACGICNSDLHTYAQGLFAEEGQVMGHEFAGEVIHVGSEVEGIAIGDGRDSPSSPTACPSRTSARRSRPSSRRTRRSR
jgi:(R,R)-butanediol dehydrogenase / meso-butanediol dehydrogenase / diacetyl reductase